MPAETFDALVIGAGPAGGVAALTLAKAGWSVAVVEKSAFPRRKVCGEFISATSLPLLHELGVGEAFTQRAGPEVRRVGLFAGRAMLDAPMPAVRSDCGSWGRALGRDTLDRILLDEAVTAGATVMQPRTVTALAREGETWRCRVSAKGGVEDVAARIVIAANGSSQPAPFLDPEARPKRPSDLLAFKARFVGGSLPDDLMPLLVFPGGYGGLVTSDGGTVSLSCCIRRDVLARCREETPGRAAEAVWRHISGSCRGVRETLGGTEPEYGWLSAGPIRPGIHRHHRDGVFFVGNRAGEAHPVIAEGISMAMQSSLILSRHLIAAGEGWSDARAAVGRAYAADWRRTFAVRITAASAIAHLVMRPPVVAVGLPVLEAFPQVLTFGASLSGKTVTPAGA